MLARFCDAVAAMPEATWFNISPNHEAYGQTASFYHLADCGVGLKDLYSWYLNLTS